MKIAELEDIAEATDMAMAFAKESPYKDFIDRTYLETLIMKIISGDKTEGIILIIPDIGMLASVVSPFPYGPYRVANELCWYVKPDHRNGRSGTDLISAFEYWAEHKANCKLISFSALNNKLDKFFKRNGYKLRERAYMKVL